eukprot:Nk52_evm31s234 gene=Nk52_evmTU31s234
MHRMRCFTTGQSSSWAAGGGEAKRTGKTFRHIDQKLRPVRSDVTSKYLVYDVEVKPDRVKRQVPEYEVPSSEDIDFVERFIATHRENIVCLTGAGVSTESGLPSYRSPKIGLYEKSKNRPIQYKEFMGSEYARKRYWARTSVGWNLFANSLPNDCHKALAQMEELGFISKVITQNVDLLHSRAGSKDVIDLHGNSHSVHCTECGSSYKRTKIQDEIFKLNPGFEVESAVLQDAPDGDAQINLKDFNAFKIPSCLDCGGILKPSVVFFGENVPKPVVQSAFEYVENANALIVLGTSLQVYSGFRFARMAHQNKKPILMVNIGPTRADELVSKKIETAVSDIFASLSIERILNLSEFHLDN